MRAATSTDARTWVPLVTLWVVWGTTYLGTSAMVQTMPPLLAAGGRYTAAVILLVLLLAVWRGPRVLLITRRQLGATAIAGIGIIGIWGALVALSLQHIPSGTAALIGATVPVWVVLLRVLTGQRVGWRTVLGIVIGIIGVTAMLIPGGISPVGDDGPATVLAWATVVVVGSMTYAFFSWRSPALDLPRDSLVTTAYQLLWGGVAVMAVGLVVGERVDVSAYSSVSWAGFAWLVLASILGYGAYTFLLQHAPLSLVSTFAFVNPAVAVLLGWLLLAEPITRGVVIGLLVVVTGTAFVVLGESRPPSGRAPSAEPRLGE